MWNQHLDLPLEKEPLNVAVVKAYVRHLGAIVGALAAVCVLSWLLGDLQGGVQLLGLPVRRPGLPDGP